MNWWYWSLNGDYVIIVIDDHNDYQIDNYMYLTIITNDSVFRSWLIFDDYNECDN